MKVLTLRKEPDLILRLMLWSCEDNCRYECMHVNYALRVKNNEQVGIMLDE